MGPSDLDQHRHANHTRYLEWLEDHLAEIHTAAGLPASVSVRFGPGAHLGEELTFATRLRVARGLEAELEHLVLGQAGVLLRGASTRRFADEEARQRWCAALEARGSGDDPPT